MNCMIGSTGRHFALQGDVILGDTCYFCKEIARSSGRYHVAPDREPRLEL